VIADLRASVERFRTEAAPLDEHAQDVLGRLITEDWRQHVVPAFKVVPRDRWNVLLHDCLSAERAMREHKPIVEKLQRRLIDADAAAKALDTVAKFVEPLLAGNDDPVREALGTLRVQYYYNLLDTRRELKERGRKTHAAAARSAGIGWLKASVKGLSGKPNRKLVLALAEAVLNLDGGEVTPDMVTKAMTPRDRLRRGREGKVAGR
jgi:hypothetical protein